MSHCPPTSSMRAHTSQVALELLPAFFVLCPCSLVGGSCFQERRSEGEGLTGLERLCHPRIVPRSRDMIKNGHCKRKPGEGLVRWMSQMLGRLCASVFGVGQSCWS